MKLKKYVISTAIIVVLVTLVAARLYSNKSGFNEELKMVSESNTTIPVITDTVKYQGMATELTLNGSFFPSHEISITAETQGKIISIRSNVGDKVVAGQVMACLDNEVSSSQLKLAKFNMEKAEKDMKRFEQLSQNDAVTTQQYESARQSYEMAQSAYTTAKVENRNTYIKAPFNGIITKRYTDNGAYVSPGTPVFDIVEINSLKFIAKLTADEAGEIGKGQHVRVTVDAYPGTSYEGKVSAVIIKADLSKRYDVEIEVANRTGKLIKPGMFGTADLSRKSSGESLIIPRAAIAGSIRNPVIFLVKGDSAVERKIVVTPFDDKYVLVNQGLKVGDVIVTSGQISLVNGSKIKLNN
jgi:membrane fusion protein, multidrug efflux system